MGDGPPRNSLGQGELPQTPSHGECARLVGQGQTDAVALRWSEVLAMRDSGVMEFHSHTHTHTRWDQDERAHEKNSLMAQELAQSRAALQAHLGGVSEHLCWTHGYFDDDYINVAHETGFRYLYTTRAFEIGRAHV